MKQGAPELKEREEPQNPSLRRLFLRVRLSMIWERLWLRLWPCVAVVIVFFSLALFGVLPKLPFWLHLVVLIGFVAVLADQLRRIAAVSYDIDEAEIRRRVEIENQLDHRPLTTLNDNPVRLRQAADLGDWRTMKLWRAHQERAQRQLTRLRVGWPRPGVAARDRIGWRFAVMLVGVIALAASEGQVSSRLALALTPQSSKTHGVELDFDIWINPPSYIGMAPLFLNMAQPEMGPIGSNGARRDAAQSGQTQPLTVPVGSTVLVQVAGAAAAPELHIGGRVIAVEPVGGGDGRRDFRVEDKFINSDRLAKRLELRVGASVLADWPLRILPDNSPSAEFLAPPKRSRKASLSIEVEALDDFGVKEVWAEISRLTEDGATADEAPIHFDLTPSGLGTTKAHGASIRDYSSHRWAGLEVSVRLFARDSAGQLGRSAPVTTVLPVRTFNHPVARALVEVRRELNTVNVKTVNQALGTLHELLQRPAHFYNDTVVFLSISVARARLFNNQTAPSVASVQELLWETALRIEDGEFSIAGRRLQDAQDRLAKALRDGAPATEIDRLMAELQETLSAYMAALAEHMERQGIGEMPMGPNVRALENMDLQNMIDQARELAKTGAMDAAKQLLSQLNRMLDGLKNGAAMARQNPEMAKARQMMNNLRSLTQRQQKLMDQTFRHSLMDEDNPDAQRQMGRQPDQSSDPSKGQPPDIDGMRRAQAELRRELGRLMLQMDETLGAIPQGMGQAERAMKGAGQSLGEGDAIGAVPRQAEAIEQLRQGMDTVAEQMARRMPGMGIGLAPGGQLGQRPGANRDPFGRPRQGSAYGAVNDDGGVKIPTVREIYRAREIMDELHRRSGDAHRPKGERDYIDRLLRRF